MAARRIALALTVLLGVAACASPSSSPDTGARGTGDRPVVVTDVYPTTFGVEQVAGDAVDVVQLAPVGVEPHDYELTPQQVQLIASADLVAYLPGMIPAVEDAVAQSAADRSVDVSAGITRLQPTGDGAAASSAEDATGGGDPHVWLDPTNMASMGRTAAAAMTARGIAADPSALEASMRELDAELRSALSDCAISTMVVSHEAFGYLAAAYGLTQVGITGLSPGAEPSPAKLASISELVRSQGITTIYFESLVSPAAADTIAAETGATTALLDPIEGNTAGLGYPGIMRANKDALAKGQSCT